MKRILLFALVALPGAAFANDAPPLERWAERTEAAQTLGSWIGAHREAATRIFHWDLDHPRRADFFFAWVADHPNETLESFSAAHPDWPVVEQVLKPYGKAVRELIAWIHAHPDAVRDFASRPRGFAYVGYHFYRPLWRAPEVEPDWSLPLDPAPQSQSQSQSKSQQL